MEICLYLVWLICFVHLTFSLPDSYEEKRVFVGVDLDMRCVGPPTSTTLIYIKWGITSGANDTPIFVCLSVTGRSCNDTHGHSLDVQNSYTSSFTIKNVSRDDAREYVCTITTFNEDKLCRFNVTIKEPPFPPTTEPPVALTLIHENEGTAIHSSFLKVRADVITTIRCLANTSVYLKWYPNCSHLSYHACNEGDPHNGSRALSFTPRANQNGTILTCRIEKEDEASGNINTSITLQVEVCVQHLEIVRHDSLESTVGGESTLRCQTNTSNFNLTSSSLFFITSYQDGKRNENTSASWENAEALYLASYELESNVNSLSCCVSKTSLCLGVCSEEYLNILHGLIYLASTDHPQIITVANTGELPGMVSLALYAVGATVFLVMIVIVFIFVFRRWRKKYNGRVPGELNNAHGPRAQPKGLNRGALPPIPTITADPSIHHSPVPSHVAQTNRHMVRGNQDQIQLQSLVYPVDDTLERVQTRTMGARSNPCTRVKTASDVEDQDMCSGYMEMRPIAPVQQYMALLGGGATIEDEFGSYVSPTLTRKHNSTTAENTFLGDPMYVNTEEVSYVNTIMKKDDEKSHSQYRL